MRDDTIVATATPPGQGGIGIVRLSGPEAPEIASRLFRHRLRDRHAVFGPIVDPATEEIIDEGIALLMRGPRSYTCEDTVEFQIHAGPVCLRRVQELCVESGARLAEPGEFSLRAFLNGRLDLAQAEAVLDVVQAGTDAARRLAISGLGGRLSRPVRELREQLIEVLAYLSARVDFPDDDVPPRPVVPWLAAGLASIQRLLATADFGMIYREGTHVAIAGAPNVGKSSLLNRLLREDRAIVTPIAGTTRDTLQEILNIGGVPIALTDTAGLTESGDPVERIGVERSRRALEASDAVLIVLDSSRNLLDAERLLLSETTAKARLVVANKCDLIDDAARAPFAGALRVSALTGTGFAELERRLAELVTGGRSPMADQAVVSNRRHKLALDRAHESLAAAIDGLDAGLPEDLASVDVRVAVDALGAITGESATEDLLNAIFRNFCIGK